MEITTFHETNEKGGDRMGKIVLSIKDTGIGIPPEHQAHIFDPFFSLKKGGTGLGLPITLGIVESHGGKLGVRSIAGEGTVVTLEFPVIPLARGEESEIG